MPKHRTTCLSLTSAVGLPKAKPKLCYCNTAIWRKTRLKLTSLPAFTDASDGSVYAQQHKRFHQSFVEVSRRYHLQELYLIEAQQLNVVYSVHKSPVFASSLKDGAFANSELAAAVKALLATPAKSGAAHDTEPGPEHNTETSWLISKPNAFDGYFRMPVMFLLAKVKSPMAGSDKPLGVLVLQLPVSALTRFNDPTAKLGKYRFRPNRRQLSGGA